MKQKSKRTLTPKLRFPEFRDKPGWEELPLSDVLSEHGYKSTGSEQVFSVSVHKGLINQIEHLGRSFCASSTEHYNRVIPGDIVYTKSPTGDFPLGIIKQNKLDVSVIVSPLYGVFSPETTALGVILDAYFESPVNAKFFLEPLVQKGAKNTINIKNSRFLSGTLILPVNKEEQQEIADCLDSLDGLIAAEGRKLAALRNHKRGLMQQLFPQPGQTQPRLRFPEFRGKGEWRECKLGKLVDISSGKSPSQYDLSTDGKYPFVKVEDLNNCTKYQVNSREYCDDAGDIVPKGSILFPKRGAAIELNKIRITAVEILIDTNLMAITPRDSGIAEFLFYYLGHVGLSQIADTSTIPQINNKHIIPFGISAPLRSEQQKIADCLTALDSLITAQAAKVDALKQHKRGLMQQLFPAPEANAS